MKPGTLKAWTKRLFIVGMYACILALCISEKVQAFSFCSQYTVKEKKTEETSSDLKNKENTAEVTTIEASENSSAVLMFTGDFMCLGGQQNAAYTKNGFDFEESFDYVRPIFSCADLVVGNLETLVSESNPYTYKQKLVHGNPNCNAMTEFLDALKTAGVQAVVTANNHSLDGGKTGIQETIEQLDEYGIAHTGTFRKKKKQQFLLCEVNGIKVAVLSYTELINARDTLSSYQISQLISCYSKVKVQKDVKMAKECGAEYIVAYNHWGTENTYEITKRQKQHAIEMAEAGVDLILGSHPHCLQEAEYITTKDGRSVLCLYSMGNFVSSMTRKINNDTIALEVVLHKNENGVFTGSIGYYPISILRTYQKKSYVVMPILQNIQVDQTYRKRLLEARKRIETVMGSEISMIH